MRSTGIIRRIDEFGRIVLPKELRKTLRIKESDSLEVFVEKDECIVLKKHSLLDKINQLAQNITDSIQTFLKYNVIITDKNNIIAASGPLKNELLDKEISPDLEESLVRRTQILEKHEKELNITNEKKIVGSYIISTIIVNSDALGLLVIFTENEKLTENDEKIIKIAIQFLIKHLED